MAAVLLPLANASAQSPITIDASKLRAELRNNSTVVFVPLTNESSNRIHASLSLDWLMPTETTFGSAHRDIVLPPGQSTAEVPLPLADSSIWTRLRYTLTPGRDDARAFAPQSGIVAISEIADHIFELHVSHVGNARPGQLVTIHALALHPKTHAVVPNVSFKATLDSGELRVPPEKTEPQPDGQVDITFRIPKAFAADADEASATVTVHARCGDFDADVDHDIRLLIKPSARLQTDKPIYQPGQTLHLRAIVFDGAGQILPDTKVKLDIKDDEGTRAHIAELTTSRFGIAHDDWTLPASAGLGDYRISLQLDDDTIGRHAVRISRYELPEFNVTVNPDREAYLPGENAIVKVTGAYLFGKPVPNGKVKITRISPPQWDSVKRSYHETDKTVSEGVAGPDGVFAAPLNLAADHTELKEQSGTRKFDDLHYVAYYTDPSSGRQEQRHFDVRITREPIHVYIAGSPWRADGTALVYVSTSYANGEPTPAAVQVRFQGKTGTLKTNRYGVGKIALPYDNNEDPEITATATDAAGRTGTTEDRYYSRKQAFADFETSHTIYRAGEPVSLSISAPSLNDYVMVEAVSQIDNDTPVARQVVKLVNGKANVTFPYQPEFRRIVTFFAWNLALTDSSAASRAVIFPDVSDLRITAESGRPTYKPGEKASIEMRAESVDGHPVEAAFGVALVDQAVLERAQTDSAFGQRRWFACMFCGDSGEQDVGGVRLNDLYSLKPAAPIPPGLDLAAELLVINSDPAILTDDSDTLQDQPPFREPERTIRSWSKPLEDYFNLTFQYPADTQSLEKVLGQRWTDLRDPWGMRYRAAFEIQHGYNVIAFESAGPDKKFATNDDYQAAKISHPWFDRTREIIAQALRKQADYPATETELKAILNTEGVGARVLRDPWGMEYSFRISAEADMRHITVMSAGPDRTFGTVDDLSPGGLIGRYFQREEREIIDALRASPEMPQTVEAFRAALQKAGIDPGHYLDAWGRPYRLATLLSSRYTDRRNEADVRIFGQPEQLRVTMTPVTQHLITFSLRSAGPDGVENTWDDFDIAKFPVVLSEISGRKPAAEIAGNVTPLKGTGVVYGIVKDPVGAIVPNVTVTLIDANSVGHETTTDVNGTYQFVSVPAGTYTLKALAPGFRSYVVSQVPVIADKAVSVDVSLQIGTVSEAIEVTSGVVLLQTSSAEMTSSPLATPRIRDYFPETLLWLPEIDSDKLGNARAKFTMADSVTNWKLAVIASTLDGRVAETESSIRSFQPFFLTFNPPPVLTAGDRLDLPVTVRNYTNHPQKATVRIEPNNWSSVQDGTSKNIPIPANDSANATFAITAEKSADTGTARIIAGSGSNRDAIEKTLKVHPDGREVTQIAGDLITAKTTLKVTIPSSAIAGANHGEIHLYPNLASMLFESAAAVLETPHGCAEQTVSAGYANLVALRYARAAGISSAALEERALKNIGIALGNLPTFEHANGGISYWVNTKPDIAVTAYALNFLVDASALASVSLDDIQSLAGWLENQQNLDGTWSAKNSGRRETAQQKLLLTSLAIRSLAAVQKSGIQVPANVFAAAYHNLALFTDQLDEPYLLSQFILAALDSGDEKLLGGAAARLIAMAHTERDGLYWDLKTNS
ncbi:MAG TPA: MG2 domain-containing protein, partial [Bryobacteraceae bacterium]|nr:MG2 domain-containing protein [Bryobacteraceae bacterium]